MVRPSIGSSVGALSGQTVFDGNGEFRISTTQRTFRHMMGDATGEISVELSVDGGVEKSAIAKVSQHFHCPWNPLGCRKLPRE
jgi:hypothetical protein